MVTRIEIISKKTCISDEPRLRCTCAHLVWEGEGIVTRADINESLLLEFHIVLLFQLLTCRWNLNAMPYYNDLKNPNSKPVYHHTTVNQIPVILSAMDCLTNTDAIITCPLRVAFLLYCVPRLMFSFHISRKNWSGTHHQQKATTEEESGGLEIRDFCAYKMASQHAEMRKRYKKKKKSDCRFLINFLRCFSKWWCIIKHNLQLTGAVCHIHVVEMKTPTQSFC